MVIPPVVVSAGVPDRAVTTAAVVIEIEMMWPRRDTKLHSCGEVGGKLSLQKRPVKPVTHDFCVNAAFGEYRAASQPRHLGRRRSFLA